MAAGEIFVQAGASGPLVVPKNGVVQFFPMSVDDWENPPVG